MLFFSCQFRHFYGNVQLDNRATTLDWLSNCRRGICRRYLSLQVGVDQSLQGANELFEASQAKTHSNGHLDVIRFLYFSIVIKTILIFGSGLFPESELLRVTLFDLS